jgi:hypothetical protein
MVEAWLLFNETAIRQAAGNPNGTVILSMPRLIDVENIPDPKDVLHNLVLAATDLPTRRRKRFDVNKAVHLIPKYIDDFSPLKNLPAFSSLEEQVVQTITDRRWHECSSERTIWYSQGYRRYRDRRDSFDKMVRGGVALWVCGVRAVLRRAGGGVYLGDPAGD